MWVIAARKQGNVVQLIGPFATAQDAAKWIAESYTPRLGTTTTIEKLTSPDEAAKPNG